MIVKAENEEESMKIAEDAFDELIARGEGGHDYHTMFNSKEDQMGTSVSGSDRWGRTINPRTLKESEKELREFIESVQKDVGYQFDKVRLMLQENTNEQILNKDQYGGDLYYFRWCDLTEVSNTTNHIYSFFDELDPVFNNKQLDAILKNAEIDKIYVVKADVHF